MKYIKQRSICLFLIVLVALFSTTSVYAIDVVDINRSVSLTIEYPCKGALFNLFFIGNINESGELSLAGEFENYPVTIEKKDTDWHTVAQTLESYAIRDRLTPIKKGHTTGDGKIRFTDLNPGLYMVSGERYVLGNEAYIPETFIICLPDRENNSDVWNYDVTANPKYEKNAISTPSENTSYSVIKIWEDSASKKNRPDSIQIDLWKDGQLWDSVSLSSSNNWKYKWEELDSSHVWHVTERSVPDRYTVRIVRNGTTFFVTNTSNDGNYNNLVKPKLPQTGMLWWPVGVMALIGILLLFMGMKIKRKENSEDNE